MKHKRVIKKKIERTGFVEGTLGILTMSDNEECLFNNGTFCYKVKKMRTYG